LSRLSSSAIRSRSTPFLFQASDLKLIGYRQGSHGSHGIVQILVCLLQGGDFCPLDRIERVVVH